MRNNEEEIVETAVEENGHTQACNRASHVVWNAVRDDLCDETDVENARAKLRRAERTCPVCRPAGEV